MLVKLRFWEAVGGDGAPALSYRVSGLSSGGTGYNGVYTANGTYAGYPAYSIGSSYWLYYDGAWWYLGPSAGSGSPIAGDHTGPQSPPDPTMYSWTDLVGYGTPTVTLA